MQRCTACSRYRYPVSPVCADCDSDGYEWAQVSGRGKIVSWVVFHRCYFPCFADEMPYNVAMIALDEGPIMVSNVLAPNDSLARQHAGRGRVRGRDRGNLHPQVQADRRMTDMYNLPLEQRVLGPILAEKARTEGDRPYMTVGGRTYSFAETDRLVRQLGRGLRQAGVRKQDLVAMLLPNGAEFVLELVRVLRDRCRDGADQHDLHRLHAGLHPEGQRHARADRRPQPRAAARRRAAGIAAASSTGSRWSAGRMDFRFPTDPAAISTSMRTCSSTSGEDPEVPCTFRDLQSVMYTSGTTGPSKGVMLPNGHFFSSTMTFMRALGITRDDVLFTPLPLFHGLASRLGVLPALMVGAQVVIAEKFSATQFWKQVVDCGATIGHTIFTIPPILKAQPPSPLDRAHRLRAMYNA